MKTALQRCKYIVLQWFDRKLQEPEVAEYARVYFDCTPTISREIFYAGSKFCKLWEQQMVLNNLKPKDKAKFYFEKVKFKF